MNTKESLINTIKRRRENNFSKLSPRFLERYSLSLEDDHDLSVIEHHVIQCLEENWTDEDILSVAFCLEEVNPMMPEDEALALIEQIKSKYIEPWMIVK